MLLLLLSLFQHDNESLKHIYSMSTVTRLQLTSPLCAIRTPRLVSVQLSCRCPPAKITSVPVPSRPSSSSTPVVHQASCRLCRQLRVHTESLVTLLVRPIVKYYARINSNISLVAPSQVVIIQFFLF